MVDSCKKNVTNPGQGIRPASLALDCGRVDLNLPTGGFRKLIREELPSFIITHTYPCWCVALEF